MLTNIFYITIGLVILLNLAIIVGFLFGDLDD